MIPWKKSGAVVSGRAIARRTTRQAVRAMAILWYPEAVLTATTGTGVRERELIEVKRKP